jgi:hypothetical protein
LNKSLSSVPTVVKLTPPASDFRQEADLLNFAQLVNSITLPGLVPGSA